MTLNFEYNFDKEGYEMNKNVYTQNHYPMFSNMKWL